MTVILPSQLTISPVPNALLYFPSQISRSCPMMAARSSLFSDKSEVKSLKVRMPVLPILCKREVSCPARCCPDTSVREVRVERQCTSLHLESMFTNSLLPPPDGATIIDQIGSLVSR